MKVLFLCTGNACRSQMAEGFMRVLSQGVVQAVSAGTAPTELHPMAIEMMAEAGIDISSQSSKHIDAFLGEKFDYVITVCDRLKESCPTWPDAADPIHWSFEDPVIVADPAAARRIFVAVRNGIAQRVRLFLAAHKIESGLPSKAR